MQDVMAMTLQAMQADATRLDRVGVNLANVTTPAYKRELAIQRTAAGSHSTFASLVETQASPRDGSDLAAVVVTRDMRVGTLKSTGQPLDFALTGHGFFEVSTPTGPAYTRHGQFQLDARGRVVTAQGDAVMGTGGDIVLAAPPVVDATGAFTEDGRVVAKLRVVDFEAAETMDRLPGGLYAAGDKVATSDDQAADVRQGYLENTNVDPMREMTDLIRTMRHFESMQRVVQGYDDMLGTAIRKLGDA